MRKTGRVLLCSVLAALLLLTFAMPALAAGGQTITKNGVTYRVNGTTATVERWDQKTSLEGWSLGSGLDQGVAVVAIEPNAFEGCATLQEISIPDVTSIGSSAFLNSALKTVSGGVQVATLGASAFRNTALKSLPDFAELTSIPDSAFSGCTDLEVATIPKAKEIGRSAFSGCTSLTSVQMDAAISVKGQAFASCSALETVEAENLESIGASAFMGCTNLNADFDTESTSFPNVKSIGQSAFANTAIKDVTSRTITSISETAFYNCTGLTKVDLSGCKNLQIGNGAFQNCSLSEGVSLPETLTSIGSGVFSGSMCDPKTAGGMAQAVPIMFAGSENAWKKVGGGDAYLSYHMTWGKPAENQKPTPTPDPLATPTNNLWNPDINPAPSVGGGESETLAPNKWVWFEEENPAGVRVETTNPKSGKELILKATAEKGTLAFKIAADLPRTSVLDIERESVYLNSAQPGVGQGMRTCEVSMTIRGRPGDKIKITLSGTYSYGGQNYPISKEITLTMRSELSITGALQNLTANEPTTLTAVWGPPWPDSATYTWTCKDSKGNPVAVSTEDDERTATFTPLKAGRYTIVLDAAGKIDGSPVSDRKTVTAYVLGEDGVKPEIAGKEQLLNMQPGDRTPLRINWPSGTPQADAIQYEWVCTPNQKALAGDTTGRSVTFAPPESAGAADYVIKCIVTVKYDAADPSTWETKQAESVQAPVNNITFTLVDNTNQEVPIVQVKSATSVSASWSPTVSSEEEEVTYQWSCTRSGSTVTNEVFPDTPTGDVAVFRPIRDGEYVVRCMSTRTVDKGRTVQRTATRRYKVGETLVLTATDSRSNAVASGAQILSTDTVTVKAEIRGTTTDESNGTTTDGTKYTWSIQGPAEKTAAQPTDSTIPIKPTGAGTITVKCSTESGASATMTFRVVDYVMTITVDSPEAPYIINKPISLKAELLNAPSDVTYHWKEPPAGTGTSLDQKSGRTAWFTASKAGTYSVSCTAEFKSANGKDTKVTQSKKITVVKESTTSVAVPKLRVISSIPAGSGGEIKASTATPLTFTAVWDNGTKECATPEWTVEKTHDLDYDANGQETARELSDEEDDGPKTITAQSLYLNNLNITDALELGQGVYKVQCRASAGTGESSQELTMILRLYDSPVLQIVAAKQVPDSTDDDPAGTKWQELTGDTKLKPEDVVKLTLEWKPQIKDSDSLWYSWTCINDKSGNVTDDGGFKPDPGFPRTIYTLTIPKAEDVESGTTYTVKCKASGSALPASVTSGKEASRTFTVEVDSTGDQPGESTEATQSIAMMAEAMNGHDAVLMALTYNAAGEPRMTGFKAAGVAEQAKTVSDILNSFTTDENHSIVVVDKNGVERTDINAAVVTGDVVQLQDNTQRGIIEEATIVIMGDMLGTGEMNLSQLVTMAKGLKDDSVLTGPYMEAGDWDVNNRINLSDLVMQASELRKSLSA